MEACGELYLVPVIQANVAEDIYSSYSDTYSSESHKQRFVISLEVFPLALERAASLFAVLAFEHCMAVCAFGVSIVFEWHIP